MSEMFVINTEGSFVDIWDGLSDYTTILGEAFLFEDGCSIPSGRSKGCWLLVFVFCCLGSSHTLSLLFFSSPDMSRSLTRLPSSTYEIKCIPCFLSTSSSWQLCDPNHDLMAFFITTAIEREKGSFIITA